MRIAFSGVQSTGKTTLINILKEDVEFQNFTFITEIVRELANQGIPINEQGTHDTQILVLGEHMRNAFKNNVVLDRCLLDGVVYTFDTINRMKNGEEYAWVKEYAANLLNYYIHHYDVIFYLKPEFDIVEDGVRSINLQYRHETQLLFEKTIKRVEDKVKVVFLTGTVEQRIWQIKNTLKSIKTGY